MNPNSNGVAVVVLGCRIASASGSTLTSTAGRRARAGAWAFEKHQPALVVAAGGRSWGVGAGAPRVEADALAEELVRGGVPEGVIERERRSTSTRENARFAREILERHGTRRVVLVTCAWHMRRAAALFRAEGFDVEPFAAEAGPSTWLARAYRVVRERVAGRLDRLIVILVLVVVPALACSHGTSSSQDAAPEDAAVDSGALLASIEIAEDTRRADLVTDAMRASRDVVVRRRAARALSRIADVASEAGLMRALGDEDAEVSAWGAYGLGFSCKGHEEARVRALAARAASFTDGGPSAIDFGFAVARAMGRCGGSLAESTLAAWVRAKGRPMASREHAAYGIGDVGARRSGLDDDTVTALLDAAGDGVTAALYPFARTERFNDAFAARLLDAAKKMLVPGGPRSDARVFAVRALAKTGEAGVPELSRIAVSADYSWAERIDAMRSLGKAGESGRVAAADALAHVLPDPKDPLAVLALAGDVFGEIVVGLSALGPVPPPVATRVLTTLSTLKAAGDAPSSLARRVATLRCTAASLMVQGNYDAPLLAACDAAGSEALERGRLVALLRKPLTPDRRAAWLVLTKSEHKKVREDALSAVGSHHELGDVGLVALASSLSDIAHPGVVATAAEVLFSHPERAMVLSARERRNALDPNAPPPTAAPEQEVSPIIAKALATALAFKWSEDAIETRVGLLDAAVALHASGAKEAAKTACADTNITVREHAQKALHALGDDKTVCAPVPHVAAKEATASRPVARKLVLATDAGTLSVVFDVDLAPVASTRILDLAQAGFYDGNTVHRVVPAFVVQLGDPQGDGYGGSGQTLRCETSPVPFGPLDVGIALGGRDTGSSQFFVTLGRFPHLDGDYARVGRAEGDWFAVAEGDVVQHAKVE